MSAARRLCMVVHAPYPRAETRVEREAHAAQEHGWDVDVLAMCEPGDPLEEVGDDGIRIFRVPLMRARGGTAAVVAREYLGFTFLAAKKVAALHRQRRYDVIQIHNPPDFLVLVGLLPRLRGARLVFDVHDLAPELFALRFEARRWAKAALIILDLMERLALHVADAVVTVHAPYRRLLVARGVPERKVTIALNSPEERLLPAPTPPTPNGRFRVVYHGTITPHYGLATLVEAVSLLRDRVPQLTVEVYGAGDALADVKRAAVDLNVADVISFSNRFLGNAEVLERVAGASVGVICNLPVDRNAAALPTKLFEYAALEIPVVSSDLPAIREYFSSDEVRFFPGGDSHALADEIAALAADPDSALAQARRARARYESYRWSEHSAAYAALLDGLASR